MSRTSNAKAVSHANYWWRHRAAVLLSLCCGLLFNAEQLSAATVSVYDGPLYVDAASSNALQSVLQAGGHTVTTFSGTPPASTDNVPDSLFVDIAPGTFAAFEEFGEIDPDGEILVIDHSIFRTDPESG